MVEKAKCPNGMIPIPGQSNICMNEAPVVSKADKLPLTEKNWHQAKAYCESTYKGGNLPSPKQWEAACGKYCKPGYNALKELGVSLIPFTLVAPGTDDINENGFKGMFSFEGRNYNWAPYVGLNEWTTGTVLYSGFGSIPLKDLGSIQFPEKTRRDAMSNVTFRCVAPKIAPTVKAPQVIVVPITPITVEAAPTPAAETKPVEINPTEELPVTSD